MPSLATVAGGRLQIRFENLVKEVLDNIKNPEYDATEKRTIKIKVGLKPNKDTLRSGSITAGASATLPKKPGFSALVSLGTEQGKPVSEEVEAPGLDLDLPDELDMVWLEQDTDLTTVCRGSAEAWFQDVWGQIIMNTLSIKNVQNFKRTAVGVFTFKPNPTRSHIEVEFLGQQPTLSPLTPITETYQLGFPNPDTADRVQGELLPTQVADVMSNTIAQMRSQGIADVDISDLDLSELEQDG